MTDTTTGTDLVYPYQPTSPSFSDILQPPGYSEYARMQSQGYPRSSLDTEIERVLQEQRKNDIAREQSAYLAQYPGSVPELENINRQHPDWISALPWQKDGPSPHNFLGRLLNNMAVGLGTAQDPELPQKAALNDRRNAALFQQQLHDAAPSTNVPLSEALGLIHAGVPADKVADTWAAAQRQQVAALRQQANSAEQSQPTHIVSSSSPLGNPPDERGSRPIHDNGTLYGSPIEDTLMQMATGVDISRQAAAENQLANSRNYEAMLNSPAYHQQVSTLRNLGLDDVAASSLARMRAAESTGTLGAYLSSPQAATDDKSVQEAQDRADELVQQTGSPAYHIGNDTLRLLSNGQLSSEFGGALHPAGFAPRTALGQAGLYHQGTIDARRELARQRAESQNYSQLARLIYGLSKTNPTRAAEATEVLMQQGMPSLSSQPWGGAAYTPYAPNAYTSPYEGPQQ